MNQTTKASFIFILTLGILSMLPPLSVDMYLPAFLKIAQDLNITPEQVQHTLTFFAYGMAAGQLFWGPVGDSFGRKPIFCLVFPSLPLRHFCSQILKLSEISPHFVLFKGSLPPRLWCWLAPCYVTVSYTHLTLPTILLV